jgi:hypothetical protein
MNHGFRQNKIKKLYSYSFLNLILALLFFWLLAIVSKIKFNGLVYGLDYGLYHPDGALYAFKTLTMLGLPELDAGVIVSNWYSEFSFKMKNIDPQSLFYDNNSNWAIYNSRILYPFLSIPFVKMFSISGMLVIPFFSLFCLMYTSLKIGIHLKKPIFGLIIAIVFSFSVTINRWMLSNLADSLLTALVSGVVLVLVKSKNTKVNFYFLLPLIILTSLTKFSLIFWVGVSLVMIWHKQIKVAFFIFTSSFLMFLPTLFGNFQHAILPGNSSSSLINKFFVFPFSFFRVGYYELMQLLILDKVLLLLVLTSIYIAIKNIKSVSSQYFLVTFFSLWVTGAINGTIGVNFRYQLPLLPFIAWVILENSKNKIT